MNSSIIYCSHCGVGNQTQATYCFSCGKVLQVGTLPGMSGTGRLSPRQMLRQRYRIVARVGQGGMGAVYKAEDTQFGGRIIAVKEMSQSGLSPQEATEAAEQLKQEAHLLAGLKHPNLPSIYDYFGENGRWYLVMDFIEGTTYKRDSTRHQATSCH
ncbi:MAG: protein kinase [Ktedonobacteraceae bacterium]|nr:protein kinase [Ktedonobacteraceae bacterium]